MMRSILVDELQDHEIMAIRCYLEEKAVPSGIDGLYWIPLEEENWSSLQKDAQQDDLADSLYRLAVELGEDWVRFELLVRAEGLRNIGGGFASESQVIFVLRWMEEMLASLAACPQD